MKVQIAKATWLFVIIVFVVAFVPARPPWRVAAQAQPPPTQAQQRPVFRGGTHFVRVDAYPFQDGKIVEGLTPADFEILEDGKPQAIESFSRRTSSRMAEASIVTPPAICRRCSSRSSTSSSASSVRRISTR